jgi:hypothetical protein
MHVPTHILSGWCFGNLMPRFGPRQRLCCMVMASVPDIDGAGIIFSQDLYWDYHHKLGHCLLFGAALSAILAWFSPRPRWWIAFAAYLAAFHLHLVLDYFGSGPDWPIYYLWPVSEWEWENPHAWMLYSWQNITAGVLLIGVTVWIARALARTPLELLMPSLDEKFVAAVRRSRPAPPAAPQPTAAQDPGPG